MVWTVFSWLRIESSERGNGTFGFHKRRVIFYQLNDCQLLRKDSALCRESAVGLVAISVLTESGTILGFSK
jgi:hypothetical protein